MELDTVDVKGKTPAHYAAKYGSIKCLKCLMKSAVDMNTGDLKLRLGFHFHISGCFHEWVWLSISKIQKALLDPFHILRH